MSYRYYETFLQVRYRSLVVFDVPDSPYAHKRFDLSLLRSVEAVAAGKAPYSGKMTQGAIKRMKKAVDILCQVAEPRLINNPVIHRQVWHTLSFITLTISGRERLVGAKEGNKELLEPWLRYMRRKYGLRSYVWKAEFQKNGQLHYHITTDAWIHYQYIRDTWNNILSSKGLTSMWDYSTGKSPNSTDVHSVYKQQDISKYLAKYMCKIDKEKRADGKVWDCSLNLKKAKFFSVPYPKETFISVPESNIFQGDYFAIIQHPSPKEVLKGRESCDYTNYLKQVRTGPEV